ncbi:hypothetical protein IAI13_37795, partial [Escherichia coli]|nr:hypothetical protein [Escherichia coli]
ATRGVAGEAIGDRRAVDVGRGGGDADGGAIGRSLGDRVGRRVGVDRYRWRDIRNRDGKCL